LRLSRRGAHGGLTAGCRFTARIAEDEGRKLRELARRMRQTAVGISVRTVGNYLRYLEKTFILEPVRPFHTNPASELTKAPTVYFLDPGMRAFAAGRFGALPGPGGLGFAFQELVYGRLRSILSSGAEEIRFWRTKDGAEVDFVVTRGSEVVPLEVKGGNVNAALVPRAGRCLLLTIPSPHPLGNFTANVLPFAGSL
jgi:uncharacterized protein